MNHDKDERINQRAYEIWEAEGRPHGRHHEHWAQAEKEHAGGRNGAETPPKADPHPGMMGDGTEEQNLGQPGTPAARIKEDEVKAAFTAKPTK